MIFAILDILLPSSAFSQKVSDPVFSPGGGVYSNAQQVAITTATAGATIMYTTDKSSPSSTNGTAYTVPIQVSQNTSIRALAFKTGMTNSILTSATYSINLVPVGAPVFTPAAGTYYSAQSVAITSPTPDALIRYTTDGSTPGPATGTVYSAAFAVSSGMTLKAIAYKAGMTDSDVVTGQYVLKCALPTYVPPAGNFERPLPITLSCSTSGVTIRYTTDGTAPSPMAQTN